MSAAEPVLDERPLERGAQPWTEPRPVDGVAGQEHLHRVGHALRALAAILVAQRGAHGVRREGHAVAAQLEYIDEVRKRMASAGKDAETLAVCCRGPG